MLHIFNAPRNTIGILWVIVRSDNGIWVICSIFGKDQVKMCRKITGHGKVRLLNVGHMLFLLNRSVQEVWEYSGS